MTNIRAEVPDKYKWDLSAIYPNLEAFEADYHKAEEGIAAFPAFEKTLATSGEALYTALEAQTGIGRLLEKLYEYAGLNSDTDTSDNAFQALRGRVINLWNKAESAMFFFDPAILRLEEETLNGFYAAFPKLEEYRRTLTLVRRAKAHTLSDECEKLLADLSSGMDSHSEIRSVFANSDLRFGKVKGEDGKEIELTDATYVPMLMSKDREVRRAAFTKMYETYAQFGNTFSALYNSYVKERAAVAKVRRFPDTLTASTYRDEVTPEIYNNLIATVRENLEPLYRYYALKKDVMGLDELHLYDIYTPLIPSCTKEYTIEQAIDEVLETVKLFGDEYYNTLKKGLLEDKWLDVFPTKGKRSGAYSAGCYDTQPYILLNFNGNLDSVSTLAHEAGHSMHSYFSTHYNRPQESSYTIFVAEVASTVNELLFAHRKLRESDSTEEKLSILNQILETYKGTCYRQTMFAEFEKAMHQKSEAGQTLTSDVLCADYYQLVKDYFGPDVVCDEQIQREWMRIPHFYTNFYVYKYATCICAASGIVKRIETEGEAYIHKYINFLKCGGSRSPLDSLKVAGIDMEKPEVVQAAIAEFSETVDAFRALWEKTGK